MLGIVLINIWKAILRVTWANNASRLEDVVGACVSEARKNVWDGGQNTDNEPAKLAPEDKENAAP